MQFIETLLSFDILKCFIKSGDETVHPRETVHFYFEKNGNCMPFFFEREKLQQGFVVEDTAQSNSNTPTQMKAYFVPFLSVWVSLSVPFSVWVGRTANVRTHFRPCDRHAVIFSSFCKHMKISL